MADPLIKPVFGILGSRRQFEAKIGSTITVSGTADFGLIIWFCAGICKRPRFYAGLGLVAARQPAVAVAVGMWEPAFEWGFQAPGKVLFGTLHG
jgi:hypothetical protein